MPPHGVDDAGGPLHTVASASVIITSDRLGANYARARTAYISTTGQVARMAIREVVSLLDTLNSREAGIQSTDCRTSHKTTTATSP